MEILNMREKKKKKNEWWVGGGVWVAQGMDSIKNAIKSRSLKMVIND